MKNLFISLTLLSVLALSSCTRLIYTHDQVLGSYKTKDEVAKRFGQPEQKLVGTEGEEWLYTFVSSKPFAHWDNQLLNTTTTEVTGFGQYDKYVIFNFDKQGTVISYRAEGVDFAKRKIKPGATIALAVGGGILVVGAIIIVLVHTVDFGFHYTY